MELSPDPSAEPVLAEDQNAVVLANGEHRTLKATGAGPGFHLGLLWDLFADLRSGRS